MNRPVKVGVAVKRLAVALAQHRAELDRIAGEACRGAHVMEHAGRLVMRTDEGVPCFHVGIRFSIGSLATYAATALTVGAREILAASDEALQETLRAMVHAAAVDMDVRVREAIAGAHAKRKSEVPA